VGEDAADVAGDFGDAAEDDGDPEGAFAGCDALVGVGEAGDGEEGEKGGVGGEGGAVVVD
jgi:hypothetical protein